MAEAPTGKFTAVTPASSANLGPGYDSFGLALGLYDVVTAEVADGLEVEVTGEGAADVPRDEEHLLVRAMRAAFDELGVAQPGLRVRCRNAIPHGRGLGSSSSAIVAGVMLARAMVAECGWTRTDVLRLADRIEGHPDNVAACIFGGLTIAWEDGEEVSASRFDVQPDVRPYALVPDVRVSTHEVRGLLPDTVPHADAAFNASRSGLLVAALTQRPELLMAATEDRLHQDYREQAMPDSLAKVRWLRDSGIAACISGAGPTVLAFGTGDAAVGFDLHDGWRSLDVGIDEHGAQVAAGEPPAAE